MSKNNSALAILLPPSTRGLGMIKSFPLDVAHLVAWLKRDTAYTYRLMDFRIHAINNDDFWRARGVDLNLFNDSKRCIDHIQKKEDFGIKKTVTKILKEVNRSDIGFMFFSVSVLEQLSLEYLMTSLCIARELKRLQPSMKIIFFGSCPKKHIKAIMNTFSFVDMFLEDGNERSIVRYLRNERAAQNLSGLSYRKNGKVLLAPAQKDVVNFNEYPVPDFSLFDTEEYKCRGQLVLPYEINRGCSMNCFYCYFTHKNSLSYKDIDRVVSDLKILSETYKTNAFHFVDGAMNSDEGYLEKLCIAFKEKLPGIKWSAMARPNMDLKLLRMMKEAGCVHLRWGVESGSARMLMKINKDTSPETIKRTLRNAHSIGIYNYVTLLTGTKVENESDIAETKEFVREIRPYINSVQECIFRELGSFDITKLECLLNGQKLPETPQHRYDEIFKEYDIRSEDIIETLAKRLKLTILIVPDHFANPSLNPGNRSSQVQPAPPVEVASINAAFKQQGLFDDLEFFDGGRLLEKNKTISDLLKKFLPLRQEEYFDKLADLMLRFTAHSDFYLFYIPGWIQNIDTSLAVAKKFKHVYPHSKIIFYGPYFQLHAERILKNFSFIDFVETSEIENFFSNFNVNATVKVQYHGN